jgi:hypothetical protein
MFYYSQCIYSITLININCCYTDITMGTILWKFSLNYYFQWCYILHTSHLTLHTNEEQKDTNFHNINIVSVRVYLQLFVGGLMSNVRHLPLFVHSGIHHILCCVFVLLFFRTLWFYSRLFINLHLIAYVLLFTMHL